MVTGTEPGRSTCGIVVLATAAALSCAPASDRAAPSFENLSPDVAWVGAARCRECHLEIAESYPHTGMGRAFFPMTPESAVEDFTDLNEIEVPGTGLRYRMVERDGRFYQRQFVPGPGGTELSVDEREMVWVLGSGNHSRSYVTLVGDELFQMPICWYPDPEIWDLCPGYEVNNDHFSREITLSCIFCHNGRMVPTPERRNVYRDPVPHGIGCERCHGPGELHVERWEGSASFTGDLDPTIVNPRRLPRGERSQVCFQCHFGDSKTSERVTRTGLEVTDYRPGMRLDEVMIPFFLVNAPEHEFGLSAQADRLVRSRCWQESGGRIDCVDCHNPHVTVYDEDREEEAFREACIGCHRVDDCTAPVEVRAATDPQDDCVSCHMRKAEADDQRHAEFTDHWIRRDIEGHEPTSFVPEMVPVFSGEFDRLPPAEQSFYRGRALMLAARDLPGQARRTLWESAERELADAMARGRDGAETRFFLGKVLEFLGRVPEAERAFAAAHELEPGHRDAAFNLGAMRLRLGRLAEAEAVFRAMLERSPDDVGALAELGRCALLAGRMTEALEIYRRATEISPTVASLRMNRGAALAALERLDEALPELEKAAALDPDDAELWTFYSELLRRLGKVEASAAASDRAKRLAKRSHRGASARPVP